MTVVAENVANKTSDPKVEEQAQKRVDAANQNLKELSPLVKANNDIAVKNLSTLSPVDIKNLQMSPRLQVFLNATVQQATKFQQPEVLTRLPHQLVFDEHIKQALPAQNDVLAVSTPQQKKEWEAANKAIEAAKKSSIKLRFQAAVKLFVNQKRLTPFKKGETAEEMELRRRAKNKVKNARRKLRAAMALKATKPLGLTDAAEEQPPLPSAQMTCSDAKGILETLILDIRSETATD